MVHYLNKTHTLRGDELSAINSSAVNRFIFIL